MACVVAGIGAIDGLHFSPPKVPVTHRFSDILWTQEQHNLHEPTLDIYNPLQILLVARWYLVLNIRRAICVPSGVVLGLTVNEARVHE